MLRIEKNFDKFIIFVIIIKILFILLTIGYLLSSNTNNINRTNYLLFWKNQIDFVFDICMAILLLYHFT